MAPQEDRPDYSMLASAVLGRAVAVGVDAAMPALARSDGVSIWINREQAGAQAPLAVIVQAALIRAGSLETGIAARLVGRPALARRYLAVEAPRAIGACAAILPRRLLAHPAAAPGAALSTSPQHSLAIAAGRTALPPPDALFGALRPTATIRATRSSRTTGVAGAAGRMLRRAVQGPDANEDDSPLMRRFAGLDLGGNPLASLLARLFDQAAQKTRSQNLAEGDTQAIDDAPGAGRAPAGILQSPSRRAPRARVSASPSSSFRYDEWDASIGHYRADWTQVRDFVPAAGHAETPKSGPIASPSRQMRGQLARMQLGFEQHRGQQGGDDFVLDDLIAASIERRGGQQGNPRIYRALRKTSRQLGILFLLDSSSSVRDPMPSGGTIHQHQIMLAWQLAKTLDDAGDRVALYGFNSWGRDRVQMMRLKSFDQRMSTATRQRLACLAPAGFTRMGAALRHAGHMAERHSGMKFRLVILITDGISYDEGYEDRYSAADTRRAIAELQMRHIACLCLSVGGETDATRLRRVFGDASFLRADRLEDVTPKLGKLFAQAIAAVSRNAANRS